MTKQGRPTKYKKEHDEQARKLCLLGATDSEIADFIGVTESTINLWKLKHPSFSESLKSGKILADANVATKLYERACGYSHTEDKIFAQNGEPLIVPTIKHYPPDTTAAAIWLNNRRPDRWRNKPPEQAPEDPESSAMKIREALKAIEQATHDSNVKVDPA